MRALSSASAVTVAAAASLLLAPAAYANGDNGTVKIHDAVTDEEYEKKNNPKVCTFYLDAFQFDDRQQVAWKIVTKPWKNGTVAETGTLTLDEEGHLRSETLSLDDGHYKLVWNFDGENGRAKHKVFKVDCDGVPEDGGDEGTVPSPSVSAGATPEPSGSAEPSAEPSSTSSQAPGTVDGTGSSAAPSAGGDLAETGSSVPAGALAAAAASMLGAGTYLVLRRRNTPTHQG